MSNKIDLAVFHLICSKLVAEAESQSTNLESWFLLTSHKMFPQVCRSAVMKICLFLVRGRYNIFYYSEVVELGCTQRWSFSDVLYIGEAFSGLSEACCNWRNYQACQRLLEQSPPCTFTPMSVIILYPYYMLYTYMLLILGCNLHSTYHVLSIIL